MTEPVLGDVHGDICPQCSAHVELGERFFEGKEYECSTCGALVMVEKVIAVYHVKLEVLEPGKVRR